MATKIPEDLVDFLESGVSILLGTRNAKNEPEAARGGAGQVSKDRERLSFLVPDATGGRVLADIAENGLVAVCFSRMLDNFSIQLKGDNATVREATSEERAIADRYKAAYIEQLYMGGLPRSLTSRMHIWPAKVVTFDVRDIFVQTPGPDAGSRLGAKT